MAGQVLAGVDIGGTKTAVVLSAEPPSVLKRIAFPTCPEAGPEPALRRIVDGIRAALASQNLQASDLHSIGVSCGSPQDPARGIIQAPPNLPTWKDVPITAILQREFGVCCHLENDANAGALAEWRFGAGKGADSMVFLTMGTGLGAGLVLNGQLYSGVSNTAGEIGHVRLTRTGPVGYGKTGSVEGWASGGGMAQVARTMVKAALRQGRPTILSALLDNGALSAKEVWEAAQRQDAVAQEIVHSTGKRLGETLAILIDLLNPQCIVIGGLAMRMGEALLGPARAVIEREALVPAARACRIVPARLREQIGDIAALCVAINGQQPHRRIGDR